jgi:regulator of PEP synthase PpsR (kinase-PPPase family)
MPERPHLHLVSDSTGETVAAVARACLVQFDGVHVIEHSWPMVRSLPQVDRMVEDIQKTPGLVVFTLVNPEIREYLQNKCWSLQIPCVAVLDPVLSAMASHLGLESKSQPGRQHVMDADYFRRIAAMEFALAHDDGQNTNKLFEADVILLGASRTSKTPTCLYLANRGVKAANIPLVPGVPLPDELANLKTPLIIGLSKDPQQLVELRRTRLRELHESSATDYIDLEHVRREIQEARRLFAERGWPVIDVSRRAIEETAAEIVSLLAQHQKKDVS